MEDEVPEFIEVVDTLPQPEMGEDVEDFKARIEALKNNAKE